MWQKRCSAPLPDWEHVAGRAEEFIRRQVAGAGASGAVLGLSGGVDSAVTAYLCSRALGSKRCLALLMPNSEFTPDSETEDGLAVADELSMPRMIIPIAPMSDAATLHGGAGPRKAVGNLNARLRAAMLYYVGQRRNLMVVGTDDRSEYLIGYFTKYGDGACDILPIVDLYKTEIWELAGHLGVPQNIIKKEPGPHLWPGHTVSSELGIGYDEIDRVLKLIMNTCGDVCDTRHPDTEKISAELGLPADVVERIVGLVQTSEHKRHLPPAANLLNRRPRGEPRPVRTARPWGGFEQFTTNSPSTVKIISVDPGASLSLQYHKYRSEFWHVVAGDVTAILGDRTMNLGEGDDLFVPMGAPHRLTGGAQGARILEIAMGDFSEHDIVRLDDRWGRR